MDEHMHSQMEQGGESEPAPAGDERLEWETPKLIVENVHSVTQGGGHINVKPDGNYYS